MEPTEQQRRFREIYAERHKRQTRVTWTLVVLVLAVAFTQDKSGARLLGLPAQWVAPAVFVAIAAALIFSFRNWRCPACHAHLGRTMNPRHCPSCGVALRD